MNPLFGLPGIASTGAVSRRKKSKPKSSGSRLAIVGGHIVKKAAVKGTALTDYTRRLVGLWGTPIYGKLGVRPPAWEGRRIAFIHWLPCGKELQPIEVFHLNMLWAFDAADFFEEIHVRVAGDGKVLAHVSKALREVLGAGRAKLDVKGIKNSETWEWGTYNEFLGAASPDADMYYMHFKGTSHAPGSARNKDKVFDDYGDFTGITFWSYLMYRALFTIRPTEEKPAVCGLLHTNPTWSPKIGWDPKSYHASGSFQGYFGKSLASKKTFIESTLAGWRGHILYMRYAVEGMLTFLYDEPYISRIRSVVLKNAGMYTDLKTEFPELFDEFCKGPEYLICQR